MLKNGMTLPDALALAQALETDTPAGPAIAHWRQLIEAGQGKPAQWIGDSRPFPPLFLWLVQKGGEDVAAGFQKAAEIYQARASYRIELALYGVLPVSILLLGQMVFWQALPLLKSMIWLMDMIGGSGMGD
jgi:type II secretory pathway component PulF